MSKYQYYKGQAREKAIDYQLTFSQQSHFMSEIAEMTAMFEKLGERYGLLREFKENGVI